MRPLSQQMQLAREISSLGRSARMNAKLKVRQPLAKVEVILADDDAPGVAGRSRRTDSHRAERQRGRVHAAMRNSTSATRCNRTSSGWGRALAS